MALGPPWLVAVPIVMALVCFVAAFTAPGQACGGHWFVLFFGIGVGLIGVAAGMVSFWYVLATGVVIIAVSLLLAVTMITGAGCAL